MVTSVHKNRNELEITPSQQFFYSLNRREDASYCYRMDESPIYQRVKQRLDEIGMSERQASLRSVGNTQFVRNLRKGLSTSPRTENLIKLARTLDVSETWLMGTSDDSGVPNPERDFGVRYGGVVEAGAFRPQNYMSQDDDHRHILMPHDSRFPYDEQFAFSVMGDSMTREKIFEGMYVLAVEVNTWQRRQGQPRDGQLVIVARTRDGHPEKELTVKKLKLFTERMELQPCSDNPIYEPLVFPLPLREADQTEVHIVAVVLSAIWIYG